MPLPLQGFDIDYFPGMESPYILTPVVGKDLNDKFYREDVELAIGHHNKTKQVGWLLFFEFTITSLVTVCLLTKNLLKATALIDLLLSV